MARGWRAVRRALTADWSLYICDEMNDEKTETVECERLSPRPFGSLCDNFRWRAVAAVSERRSHSFSRPAAREQACPN